MSDAEFWAQSEHDERRAEREASKVMRAALEQAKVDLPEINACLCGTSRESGKWVTCPSCYRRQKLLGIINAALSQ